MSQVTTVEIGANPTGTALRTGYNAILHALNSGNIGSTAPSSLESGSEWIDNTTSPWILKRYDGASWIIQGYYDTSTHVFSRRPAVTTVTSTSGAATINIANGESFTHTLTENTTYTFSGAFSSGKYCRFTFNLLQAASAKTVTWPMSVIWEGNAVPAIATNSAKYSFTFETYDGGTTWFGRCISAEISPAIAAVNSAITAAGAVVAVTLSGGNVTLDLSAGRVFKHSPTTGNLTLVFSNPDSSGTETSFVLYLTKGSSGNHTVAFPSGTKWSNGSAPVLNSNSTVYKIGFSTIDGGTTYDGVLIGENLG